MAEFGDHGFGLDFVWSGVVVLVCLPSLSLFLRFTT